MTVTQVELLEAVGPASVRCLRAPGLETLVVSCDECHVVRSMRKDAEAARRWLTDHDCKAQR